MQAGEQAAPGRCLHDVHVHVRPFTTPTGTRRPRSPIGREGRADHGCTATRAAAAARRAPFAVCVPEPAPVADRLRYVVP
jgi:hypothetical protein